jgi:hypothetical protein
MLENYQVASRVVLSSIELISLVMWIQGCVYETCIFFIFYAVCQLSNMFYVH